MLQENKARQIFRKTNISYPLIRTRACEYQGNVCFSENLARFFFFWHSFWDLPFCVTADDICLSYIYSLNLWFQTILGTKSQVTITNVFNNVSRSTINYVTKVKNIVKLTRKLKETISYTLKSRPVNSSIQIMLYSLSFWLFITNSCFSRKFQD